MWRLIFAKVFGCKVCVTEDFDGELRWRFMFKDPRGGYRARAIGINWVHLNADGSIRNFSICYVRRWYQVAPTRREE